MSFQMKANGVDWIGCVPCGWRIKRVKDLFSIGRGRVIAAEEMSDLAEFPVYSSQTKNNGCMGYISTFDFDREQITWTTDGANAGSVFKRSGRHNCTNVCGTLFAKQQKLNLGYFTYFLTFATIFYKRPDTNGAKIMNGEMGRILVLVPPLPEQIAIASYLDKTTAHIDKQRSLLERKKVLLQEHKKALIHEAVTEGLNPNGSMKASGVGWLGEVPAHWIICRAKEFLNERSHRSVAGSEDLLAVSAYYGVKVRKDVLDEGVEVSRAESLVGYKIACKSDLVVNTMLAWNGSMGIAPQYGIVSPAYAVYCISAIKADPTYICYLMKSTSTLILIRSASRGINDARLRLYPDRLGLLEFALPPKTEQISIAVYLNKKLSCIDRENLLIEKKIELLGKLRESIIHEAVTKGVPAAAI